MTQPTTTPGTPVAAFIFPGQGSQSVGMGKALAEAFPEAREVFQAVDEALGERLSALCFEGPEAELTLTANTQPAILATSVAAHRVFAARCGLTASFVAGHSLGEYSALVAAGTMALADAARAVRARGAFMQEAVPPGVGAMAAVLGVEAATVMQVCVEQSNGEVVSPANFNEPTQTVIAGHAGAVARAGEALKARGAKRVVPLAVSAPFHCALMQPVVPRLDEVLSGVRFQPGIPAVTNVEAAPNAQAERTRELLLRQVTGAVRWVESVQALERLGVTHLVELGPGKVLSGLVRRISRGLTVVNVEDVASLNKALEALQPAPREAVA